MEAEEDLLEEEEEEEPVGWAAFSGPLGLGLAGSSSSGASVLGFQIHGVCTAGSGSGWP